MPVELSDMPIWGFCASSLPLSTRILSRRLATCWALSLPVPMCTSMSSGSLNPMASATVRRARVDWALEMPRPCLRISRVSLSRPNCRSSERVTLEKYERILLRALGVFTTLSQSREGPADFWVRISTRSPTCSS